jgi:hypothetical protein
VKGYELVSESEESLPDSEFDSNSELDVRFEVSTAVTMMIIIFWEMIIISELDDCAILDVVVNGDIDDDISES